METITCVNTCQKENTATSCEKNASCGGNNEKQWICGVCGYVYGGDIAFEDLASDWRCPLCGVKKEVFELH